MITDKIENAHLYAGLSEKFSRAFEVLKNTNFAEKENGRYDIDGDNIYYFVQRGTGLGRLTRADWRPIRNISIFSLRRQDGKRWGIA